MDKVLVIQAARFGDLIQTKRLLLSLSRHYEVHLALDKSLTTLAALLFPSVILHKISFHMALSEANIMALAAEIAPLAKIDFKYVYNCNYSPFPSALSRLFPQEKVIGIRAAEDPEGGMLASPWARLVFKISKNRVMSPLNLVDYWAWFSHDPVSCLQVNPPAKAGGEGLGVILSGRESRRSLPPPVLANIVNIIANILKPPKIRLFGTNAELPLSRRLLQLINPKISQKIENRCGQTDYLGLYEETLGLDLLLAPDTGSMHLGAALGVPVLAFFLSSALCHETGPYGDGHYIWQAVQPCSPCLESATCNYGTKCLEIFSSPQFGRHLSALFSGKWQILAELPETIQLWKTGGDTLGQKLQLLAGKDNYATRRESIRNILLSYHNLPQAGADDLPGHEISLLCKEFFPPQEWMLPPQRYF